MNWIYIAGFFDGEGSVSPNNGGFRISIPQTNQGVLNEIHNFTKVGFVIAVKKRQAHWKDSWTYYIASKKDAYYFLNQIIPYLVVKKDIALEAIAELGKQLHSMEDKRKIHNKRKIEAKLLRSKGWDYRRIGEKLNIDWGYARRLVLDLA